MNHAMQISVLSLRKSAFASTVICLSPHIAHADDMDVCEILAHKIQDESGSFQYRMDSENIRTLVCSEEMKTEEKARSFFGKLGLKLKNIVPVEFNVGGDSKNYVNWRKKVCSDHASAKDSEFINHEYLRVANPHVLNLLQQCLPGLSQSLESLEPTSRAFVWSIRYRPSGVKATVDVGVALSQGVECSLKRPGKKSRRIKGTSTLQGVSAAGVSLSCERSVDEDALLTINSNAAQPKPPTLSIPAQGAQETFSAWFDMKAPITVVHPPEMRCTTVPEGSWRPHCPREGDVLACPALQKRDGYFFSEFDTGHYDDNCGSCRYRIRCIPAQRKP